MERELARSQKQVVREVSDGAVSAPTLADLARQATEKHPSTPELIVNVLRQAIVTGCHQGW